MFYDKFVSLCAQKGESPSQVAKNIGLSNAAATGWKNGKKPNDITLRRLSDYFSVPVEDLKDVSSAFYNNYVRLCAEKNISPSAAALDIGIKKSNVTYWKNGRNNPSDVTLIKIADYFGVTVAELTGELGEGIKKERPAEGGALSGADKETAELREIWNSADSDERQMLLEIAKTLKSRRK